MFLIMYAVLLSSEEDFIVLCDNYFQDVGEQKSHDLCGAPLGSLSNFESLNELKSFAFSFIPYFTKWKRYGDRQRTRDTNKTHNSSSIISILAVNRLIFF